MDAYGLGVAATLNASTKMVFQSKNLIMRIDHVDQNSTLRKDGLQVAYNQSSIFLPPQVFHSSQDSKVVTLVYLTLGGVLSLKKKTGGKMFPRTTIVSSTVEPRPLDDLKNPVKIILQNRKVLPRAVTSKETHCVFWRPKEPPAMWKTSGCQLVRSQSNASITTCECDHLTVFAALMDPYGLNTTLPHKQALEIISIIGCSISLFSVLLTMAVTLVFWREIKGSRVKVLLNLCAAIACSCILAILEGSARNKEPECTVVAALLHYFLLALFSWMLCEGILHYIVIVRVLHGHAEDKVKFFYLFGWGFPAIMVIISLSVTQLKRYGHKEACWLNADEGLIWAFIVPALGVILVNIVVFILVMRQMMGTKYMQNKTQVEKVRTGVKASGVILPLLGITWLFGLLSFNSDTIIFKYIFTIFNSLQGLMIFIFHCILNKQIKDAFRKRRKRWVSARHDKRTSLNLKNKFEAAVIPGQSKNLSNPIKDGVDQLPETRGIHSDTMKFSTFISQDDVGCGVVQDLPLEGNIN
ncbi:adhesion G-protein coupled receptor D1-like [Porites lutea]|uniref:adhesion G-protein coupled receptor D1-like n=1 Tax=Porites lutea TaxID=51062 RepID=UPI003CC66305